MTMTTIKVPTEVRDRLRERAEAQGISQGEALARLLDATPAPDIESFLDDVTERWGPLLDRLA
ncbi:hypothetical protein [Isoptericola dokdonensis]|jgi:hypothetical protein|nr:hypothetical protein [Isoptericola dokdonensis]